MFRRKNDNEEKDNPEPVVGYEEPNIRAESYVNPRKRFQSHNYKKDAPEMRYVSCYL